MANVTVSTAFFRSLINVHIDLISFFISASHVSPAISEGFGVLLFCFFLNAFSSVDIHSFESFVSSVFINNNSNLSKISLVMSSLPCTVMGLSLARNSVQLEMIFQ